MNNSLRMIAIFVALWGGLLSNAKADAIPYATSGTENSNTYTFTAASTGHIGAYFFDASAGYTNSLSLLVNGVITPESAAGVLNNHASNKGDFVNLGSVHTGDILTFQLNVITKGDAFFSNKALNTDGVNHIYSTSFSGDFTHSIPSGTYVAFEDVRGGGDFDYNDETFVFTNISPIPEPETYAMLLLGLGVIGFMARLKKHNV